YNTLWRTLDEEFDAEPAPETQKLYADIKLGLIGPRRNAGARASPPPAFPKDRSPVLIVESVEDAASDPALSRTLAGLRLELISLLVRFREWTVVDWAHSGSVERRATYTVLL